MEEPALNAHNKDEFPPAHTSGTGSFLESIKNPIYKDFFSKNKFVLELEKKHLLYPTIWRGIESHNSLSFKDRNVYRREIPEILKNTFGIKNDLFLKKYNEAISGDGQEWTRITTLHSSSLLALLCFYSVSENHQLYIGDYVFTESFFEVKTHVHENSESNMDVVLRGKDKDGKKTVLFLESKFSEYLDCGKYDGISHDAYYNTYNDLSLFDGNKISNTLIGIDSTINGIYITPIDNKEKPIYCGGIKQMLSHYIGVSNYATNREKSLAEHLRFKFDKEENILLGEILFDFNDRIKNAAKKLNNYKTAYNDLAKIINNNQKKIKMLDEVLLYQDLFNDNFIKEDNIKSFYNFNYGRTDTQRTQQGRISAST